MHLDTAYFTENNKKNNFRLLFINEIIVHFPVCIVHQVLDLKKEKEKEKAENTNVMNVNVTPNRPVECVVK